MTKRTPYLAVVLLKLQHALKVLDGLWIVFFDPSNSRDLSKPWQGHRVMPQCIFICCDGVFEIAHLFGHTPNQKPRLLISDG
jgi:hypothetical protein